MPSASQVLTWRTDQARRVYRSQMIDKLFEKVGGSATIRRLVDRFYDRVLADPRLAPFFPETDMQALRTKQVMFITMLLGQPGSSTVRHLNTAHAGTRARGLNDEHFDAILEHFRLALSDVGAEAQYSREILARIETTRDAVLGRTPDRS
jgi:hemoglobin